MIIAMTFWLTRLFISLTGMWISYLIQKKNRNIRWDIKKQKTCRLFETTDWCVHNQVI